MCLSKSVLLSSRLAIIASMQVLELPKGLFTAGYKAILHVHSVTEECEIQALISQIDPKTKTEKKVRCMQEHAYANCAALQHTPSLVLYIQQGSHVTYHITQQEGLDDAQGL